MIKGDPACCCCVFWAPHGDGTGSCIVGEAPETTVRYVIYRFDGVGYEPVTDGYHANLVTKSDHFCSEFQDQP